MILSLTCIPPCQGVHESVLDVVCCGWCVQGLCVLVLNNMFSSHTDCAMCEESWVPIFLNLFWLLKSIQIGASAALD